MSGGVAQNAGVVRCLEKGLDTEISTSPLSQLFGALGAAVLAYERVVQPVVQK
jgi:activator of 2-hydroxyglutaryl-CoA dehydratase